MFEIQLDYNQDKKEIKFTLKMASEIVDENSTAFLCSKCLQKLKIFDDKPTPSTGEVNKYLLTQCNHVICQNCCAKYKEQCPACGKKTRFMDISRNMPENYQLLFEPYSVLQALVSEVLDFHHSQNELIQSIMADKFKRREQQLKKAVNEAKEKYEASKVEARKTKIIYSKILAQKQ